MEFVALSTVTRHKIFMMLTSQVHYSLGLNFTRWGMYYCLKFYYYDNYRRWMEFHVDVRKKFKAQFENHMGYRRRAAGIVNLRMAMKILVSAFYDVDDTWREMLQTR